jgi:hypothetical protein
MTNRPLTVSLYIWLFNTPAATRQIELHVYSLYGSPGITRVQITWTNSAILLGSPQRRKRAHIRVNTDAAHILSSFYEIITPVKA